MQPKPRDGSPPTGGSGGSHGNNGSGWFRRWVVGQFTRPRGLWGHVAGWIMARRNRERIEWTVELLHLQPHHTVLEVGFGPGVAIEAMAQRVTAGRIVGVDHSAVMLRQAKRRNARAVREGRVRLVNQDARDLQMPKGPFDRVVAINVAQFWELPAAEMRKLRSLMAPGGLLAVTLQPRDRGATDDMAREKGQALVQAAEQAGFAPVRLEMRSMKPVAAACVLATNPEM